MKKMIGAASAAAAATAAILAMTLGMIGSA
jgi:hypothetical protein